MTALAPNQQQQGRVRRIQDIPDSDRFFRGLSFTRDCDSLAWIRKFKNFAIWVAASNLPNPSTISNDPVEKKWATWLSDQRKSRHEDSKEWIILRSLGCYYDVYHETIFKQTLKHLIAFKNENGHLLVKQNYEVGQFALGEKVSHIRSKNEKKFRAELAKYNSSRAPANQLTPNTAMTDESFLSSLNSGAKKKAIRRYLVRQRPQLVRLGFHFNEDGDTKLEVAILKLEKYYEKNGHCCPDCYNSNYGTTEQSVYHFINRLESTEENCFKWNDLNETRRDRLRRIGVTPELSRSYTYQCSWDQSFKKYELFVQRWGSSVSPQGDLGRWMADQHTQITRLKNGDFHLNFLTDERLTRLGEVGFDCLIDESQSGSEAAPQPAQAPAAPQPPQPTQPQPSASTSQSPQPAQASSTVPSQASQSSTQAPPSSSVDNDLEWSKHYPSLKEYYDRFGHSEVFLDHESLTKYLATFMWAHRQRQLNEAGQLSPEKIRLLRKLRFNFTRGLRARTWERRIELHSLSDLHRRLRDTNANFFYYSCNKPFRGSIKKPDAIIIFSGDMIIFVEIDERSHNAYESADEIARVQELVNESVKGGESKVSFVRINVGNRGYDKLDDKQQQFAADLISYLSRRRLDGVNVFCIDYTPNHKHVFAYKDEVGALLSRVKVLSSHLIFNASMLTTD